MIAPGSGWLRLGLASAVVLAGCNDGAGSRAAGVPTRPAATPAASPRPAVALPSPAPSPTRPADFVLAGQLTQGGWMRGTAPEGADSVALDGAELPLARDGSFIAAFDRDAPAAAQLTARLADGRSVTRALTISKRAWNIEHVAVGPRPGAMPSAEYQRRRAGEIARINAARAINAESDGWRQNFVWPVQGRLSGMFGNQRIYRGTPGSYHSGMDIAASSGTAYVAPADGVVILAAESPFTLEGNLLMIDHGMGLNSAFLHSSQILVREGDRVRQGQVIGRVGMTGRATGPHLHWSMKWRRYRLDPILFSGPMR